MNARVEAVLPFWLDRPDEEALEIARTVGDVALDALWIGEMVTYDAFALATAIGHRVSGLPLRLGPLAVGVRSPVTLALGVSSVASLTGTTVDIALGASSPMIVAGWHDREWAHAAPRVRATIECLRSLFAGERSDYDGGQVRSHGFRLRRPRPETRIAVGAFGPAITRVAARHADEVVLNLVPPQRVAQVRATIDGEAAKVGRTPPSLTVWVPAAYEPGEAGATPIGGPAGGLSRPTRIRRDVLRARLRRPRPARPRWRRAPGTGRPHPRGLARANLSCRFHRTHRREPAGLPRGGRRLRCGGSVNCRGPRRPGRPHRRRGGKDPKQILRKSDLARLCGF